MVRIDPSYKLFPHVPLGINKVGLLAYIKSFKEEFGAIQKLKCIVGVIEKLNGDIIWCQNDNNHKLVVHEDHSYQIHIGIAFKNDDFTSLFKILEFVGYFILHSKRGVWPMRVTNAEGAVKQEAQLFAAGILYDCNEIIKRIASGGEVLNSCEGNIMQIASKLYGFNTWE